MPRSARDAAAHVDDVFRSVSGTLDVWRPPVEEVLGAEHVAGRGTGSRVARLDACVAALVLPELARADPLLVGAGVIADSPSTRDADVHFAWWLGPLEGNPVLGATTEPTRLDLSTRGYTEYLRDFRALEWYRVPATTHRAHVTGPYVDHLCTCDYIVTVTMPLSPAPSSAGHERPVAGVVGADIAVRRLEQELLPAFLDVPEPLALVGPQGRVVISTSPSLPTGSLAASARSIACTAAPFAVLVDPRPAPPATEDEDDPPD